MTYDIIDTIDLLEDFEELDLEPTGARALDYEPDTDDYEYQQSLYA